MTARARARPCWLQWGLTREGEERTDKCVRSLSVNMLQWGLTREGEESDWRTSPSVIATKLQWGLTREGEESEAKAAAVRANGSASMGPHP